MGMELVPKYDMRPTTIVSISYMGMEPIVPVSAASGNTVQYQSPIWVWNTEPETTVPTEPVSISYMGMEQQYLVYIKIITSKYGYVKIK